MSKRHTVVISVGGSLLVPDNIDISFIRRLKEIVKTLLGEGIRVALTIGGGKTARTYQSALKEFEEVTKEDLDWVGIKALLLNAEFVLRAFSDLSPYPRVLEKPEDFHPSSKEGLFIIGAHKPGFSSDMDAVLFAKFLGAEEIINFSNIEYVYDSDPRVNPNAKKFEHLTWESYRSLIPKEWTPGLSVPFDPVASEYAHRLGLKVVVLGASLENLRNYLQGGSYRGTVIS